VLGLLDPVRPEDVGIERIAAVVGSIADRLDVVPLRPPLEREDDQEPGEWRVVEHRARELPDARPVGIEPAPERVTACVLEPCLGRAEQLLVLHLLVAEAEERTPLRGVVARVVAQHAGQVERHEVPTHESGTIGPDASNARSPKTPSTVHATRSDVATTVV
jgi:hypothetical protein